MPTQAIRTSTHFIARHLRAFVTHMQRVKALSLPYFRSEERWRARGLLLAIVALNLGTVYIMVLLNDWNRSFYDALQNRDQTVFWQQLIRFSWLAGAFIVVAVYKFYLTQVLELRWRQWMTHDYLQRWLAGHAFYQLELSRFGTDGQQGSNATPDNPDQRIQEDVNQFTGQTVSLTMDFLNASVTLVSFIGILWKLSGSFGFDFGGEHHVIPGFMVWAAVLYCALGSLITHWMGRPLVGLNFRQQRFEADFRHHLMRVREYSEAIALDRGGDVEQAALRQRFGLVLGNFWSLLRKQKNLLWFTTGFSQVATVFPMVVAAPRYFSGAIQLGDLMQVASAFGQVQDSLSWFVGNYTSLAAWSATAQRLTSFEDSLARLPADTSAAEETGETLALSELALQVADGRSLLVAPKLQLRAGEHVLLSGPSGSGKSTLFRALAGIWPWTRGSVIRPSGFAREAMFLPQRPYLPQGRLRDALAYPETADRFDDASLRQALVDALLPDLADQLDVEATWNQRLSGGEQQRLALARVLLRNPRWLFADEATSALDQQAESTLYQRVLARLGERHGSLVSIAHRASVQAFHAHQWRVQPAAPLSGAPAQLLED